MRRGRAILAEPQVDRRSLAELQPWLNSLGAGEYATYVRKIAHTTLSPLTAGSDLATE